MNAIFAVGLTHVMPGYKNADFEKLGLRVFDVSDNNGNLTDKLGELRKQTSHLDALALCIADTCDAKALQKLSTLYPQCKLLANYGVGYNHIDFQIASQLGIRVTNTPGVLTDATADIALALLLMTTRRLFEGATLIKQTSQYAGWKPDYMLGSGLQNKTIGIVGFGEIGKAFARRIESLGTNYVVLKAPWSTRQNHNDLDEAEFLAKADAISFHCKLTPQSRGWLNAERLGRCKKGVVIINTARGEIIDEAALAEALNSGQVSAAGLDVFCHEPKLSDDLQHAPNLIVLPHLGSATFETRKAMSEIVVKNILAFSKGEIPLPNEVRL